MRNIFFASVLVSSLFAGSQSYAETAVTYSSKGGERQGEQVTESPVLTPGLSHFYFKDWAGPQVPVWVYVPLDVDASKAPIMFLMHGAKRGPARYLSEWDHLAEEGGFIIVAPEFTKDDFPGSRSYNLGNMYTAKTREPIPEDQWSFSAIELIFDQVVTSLEGQQQDYTLYGHSAGSQFVHRFLFFKPEARVNRYLAANAGWYTMPDLTIPFPYGLGETDITEADLRRALSKDVVILLGDADNDPDHSSLRRTDEAMAQGPHRYARGLSYFDMAKSQATELGVEFGWRLRVIEDVAHSNGGIAQGSADLVD